MSRRQQAKRQERTEVNHGQLMFDSLIEDRQVDEATFNKWMRKLKGNLNGQTKTEEQETTANSR
jgi:hypothetical protein